jgi:integrase/recombinase XerD
MDQVIQDFVVSLAADRGASPHTLGAYQTDLRQLEDFVQQLQIGDWAEVDLGTLQAFSAHLAEREYAPTSIVRKLAAARAFFRYLHRVAMIGDDPARSLGSPRVEKMLPPTLTQQEVALLFRQIAVTTPAGLRDAAMLRVLHATGLRVSELVALAVADLDADLGYLRCTARNGRGRRLPLSPPAQTAVADYLRDGRPRLTRDDACHALFVNHHGERLTRQGFWLIMKGYARAAGIGDITPHTLRHSFALSLIGQGVEMRSVQELLGHANMSTTQLYRQLKRARSTAPEVGENAPDDAREALTTLDADDTQPASMRTGERPFALASRRIDDASDDPR